MTKDTETRKKRRPRRDEIAELVQHGKVRNALITAQVVRKELREAAARVVRLSRPGSPERLLTLMAVANETGIRSSEIVDEILRAKAEPESK